MRGGGVLEHPQYSGLFKALRLPLPGELPDAFGGRTYEIRQVSWGHACVKPTWLYTVAVPPETLARGIRSGGEPPTHRMTNGPRGPSARTDLIRASNEMRSRTPVAFRDWLLSLARAASKARAA